MVAALTSPPTISALRDPRVLTHRDYCMDEAILWRRFLRMTRITADQVPALIQQGRGPTARLWATYCARLAAHEEAVDILRQLHALAAERQGIMQTLWAEGVREGSIPRTLPPPRYLTPYPPLPPAEPATPAPLFAGEGAASHADQPASPSRRPVPSRANPGRASRGHRRAP